MPTPRSAPDRAPPTRSVPLVLLLALAATLTACGAPDGNVDLTVDDEIDMVDGLPVEVDGVPAGESVTVWARLVDAQNRPWTAWGAFEADGQGRVDTAAQVPLAGTWETVDPHGLLWSMRLPDGHHPDPPFALLTEPSHTIEVGADIGGRTATRTTVARQQYDPGVDESDVRDDELVGTLYRPPGDDPAPGVVLFGGSEGGLPAPGLPRALASEGYAVLALAYFGVEHLPAGLEEIPVEYGVDGVEWLATHDAVADAPIAVVGASKGSEYALLVGAASDLVGGVAAALPSGYAWSGLPAFEEQANAEVRSSWTRGGEPVDHLEIGGDARALGAIVDGLRGHPVALDVTYDAGIAAADEDERRAAELPVEEVEGPVLALAAGDDALWPARLADVIEVRAEREGVAERVTRSTAEDAGHLMFDQPGLPTTHMTGMPYVAGIWIDAGGEPSATAAGAREGWAHLTDLLADATSDRSEP
ncbi:acyl-CoA thioesterase/BAAT N-terminal domain-containing protein [Egibacter rhizosphaerae]|uniref:acyl-CoA thioesterase/BAAT N-terminal domain-containing protein n=1 Tax=Egibacter rhizosphaerae TaxID=1670831 RepID=UPI0013F1484D|nr:acyl-CoA thioesterase/BAAT N-terminal domain-containing protein [Egibacter rhizosphaerae]